MVTCGCPQSRHNSNNFNRGVVMNKYTCVLCGDEQYDLGNNPKPLMSSGKCCDKCDMIFVTPARLLGFDTLDEQFKFMDDSIDELPNFVIKHQDKVYKYVNSDFINKEWTGNEYEAELEELYDEWVNHKPISKKEQHDTLCKALDNAIENEYFEAASKIHKRIKELESL